MFCFGFLSASSELAAMERNLLDPEAACVFVALNIGWAESPARRWSRLEPRAVFVVQSLFFRRAACVSVFVFLNFFVA